MGHVLRVWDTELDRPIAVKVITEGAARRPENVRRFQAEMRLLGQIRHPSIVTVYGGRMNDDFAYFLMSYVPGGNLRHHLDQRQTVGLPFSIQETVDCLRPIADALDAIHNMNPPVIHRDIKPANILIPDRSDGLKESVLTDFGISQVIGDPRLTQVGTIIGSERYLAPERYSETTTEPQSGIRSDNYALALVAWEMLTLTPLFTTMSLEQWRFSSRPMRVTPTSLAPGDRRQAEALTGLFEWLLSPEPSHRPSSAVAAVNSLAALATAGGTVRSLGPVPASAYRPLPTSGQDRPRPAVSTGYPEYPAPSDHSLPHESGPFTPAPPRSHPYPSPPQDHPGHRTGESTGATGSTSVAVFRRRRIILATVVVLLVLAVSGLFLTMNHHDAAEGSGTGEAGPTTVDSRGWTNNHADLVNEFPWLLSSQPGSLSDLGLVCEPAAPGDDQLVAIACHGSSATVTLARYPTIALRDEHRPDGLQAPGRTHCVDLVTDSVDTTWLLPLNLPVVVIVTAPADIIHSFVGELCPDTGAGAGKNVHPQTFQL
jgi:serine/threonine protein kinase